MEHYLGMAGARVVLRKVSSTEDMLRKKKICFRKDLKIFRHLEETSLSPALALMEGLQPPWYLLQS